MEDANDTATAPTAGAPETNQTKSGNHVPPFTAKGSSTSAARAQIETPHRTQGGSEY